MGVPGAAGVLRGKEGGEFGERNLAEQKYCRQLCGQDPGITAGDLLPRSLDV